MANQSSGEKVGPYRGACYAPTALPEQNNPVKEMLSL